MTVEIVNYITDLDVTNPKGADKIAEGDNHIRNIKVALTESFPNIDAPVLATPDELNNLQGLTESVPPALPEVPTEEGSMLVNKGSKWSEDVTMKVLGDKLYIPALAGIGKLNLYVDENGEVLASEMATDPTMQHDLNFHTDVDFQGVPEEDDYLIHDGIAWRAKKSTGGNTMQPYQQPKQCGDFQYAGWNISSWESRKGDGVATFTVPAGMKFILVNAESYDGEMLCNTMKIDGVTIWPDSGRRTKLFEADAAHFGSPNFVAKQSIQINLDSDFDKSQTVCNIVGYFQEDK